MGGGGRDSRGEHIIRGTNTKRLSRGGDGKYQKSLAWKNRKGRGDTGVFVVGWTRWGRNPRKKKKKSEGKKEGTEKFRQKKNQERDMGGWGLSSKKPQGKRNSEKEKRGSSRGRRKGIPNPKKRITNKTD